MLPVNENVKSIDHYLDALRQELAGSDPALIQDAMYDAEEYLRSEAEGDAASFHRAIERFGTPREVAEAYRSNDRRVSAALAPPTPSSPTDWLQRLLSVFSDPHAYGSLLYMVLAFPTGILYFVWTVTGVALSAGLSVLVIGLPFFLAFLASIRFLSLVEGRLVESLTGVRMPRRPQHPRVEGSIFQRLGSWLGDRRTWTTMLYMLLRLPVGILNFVLFIVLLTLPLALLAIPFTQEVFNIPVVLNHDYQFFLPAWMYPLCWLAAGFDLLMAMLLARFLGRAQAAMAKSMLVWR